MIQTESKLHPLRLVALFALVTVSVWIVWAKSFPFLGRSYSPDSYSYFMLGQSIFQGKGFTTQAINDLFARTVFPNPSRSFPPLYPLLIGAFDWLVHTGIRSGTYVNFAVVAITAAASFILAHVVAPERALILALAFPIFCSTDIEYVREVAAGRAIPLSILFSLGLAVVVVRAAGKGLSRTDAFGVGVLLCALSLTRFDQLLFVLGFLVCSFFAYPALSTTRPRGRRLAGITAGAFAALSVPWAARNIHQFGVPFASHNSVTAWSTYPGSVHLCFWKGTMPATLFGAPTLWLHQRIHYCLNDLTLLVTTTDFLALYVPLFALVSVSRFERREKLFFLLAVLFTIGQLSALSLTAYADLRYFSFLHFIAIFSGLLVLLRLKTLDFSRRIASFVAFALLAVLALTVGSQPIRAMKEMTTARGLHFIPYSDAEIAEPFTLLSPYLQNILSGNKNAVVAVNNADVFTYYTGLRSVFPPRNPEKWDENMQSWFDKWKPSALIETPEWIAAHGLSGRVVSPQADGLEVVDLRRMAASLDETGATAHSN